MRGEKVDSASKNIVVRGSPPHARGKDIDQTTHVDKAGITPACAGKSCQTQRAIDGVKDHPRMRGEK